MNKAEFINTLETSLGNIPVEEKKDILYDYEEHFSIGLENNKTEDEIAEALGNPRILAKQFKADYAFKQAENNASTNNIIKAVIAGIGLGLFNLIFLSGIFLSLIAVLISLFVSAFAVVLSGIILFLGNFIISITPYISLPFNVYANPVGAILFSVGIICLGLLFFIGDCYISKYFYKATLSYLKWNLKIIKNSN